MRIQHNIAALSAYRNLTNNNSAVSKSLEKLSSGYRINRAGDDAAGLAISEKMRAQITGLETAQKNANDGISLVQTAEGALTEVHSMLNRMVALAEQSANGTYDNAVDRAQLQKEIVSLSDEINRIADSSNFNGIKLLDGSMDASSTAKADALAAAEAAQKAADEALAAADSATGEIVLGEEKSGADKMLEKSTNNDPTDANDGVGQKTILESDYKDTGKPGFSVSFDGVSTIIKDPTDETTGDNNDASFTLTIKDQKITVTEKEIVDALGGSLKAGDKITGEDIAKALETKLGGTWSDGVTPAGASGANSYKVTRDGDKLIFEATNNLDKAPTRHYDVTIHGVKQKTVAASGNIYTTGKLTQTGLAGTQDTKVTVAYVDKDGQTQSKELTFESGGAAAETYTNLEAAINADDDLKALFTVSGDENGIILTSKDTGADTKVKVTGVTVSSAGTDGVAIAAGEETAARDAYDVGTDGYVNFGTEVTVQAGPAAVDQLASTTLEFTADELVDGTAIRLGDQTYIIAVGEDSKYKDVENAVYVDSITKDTTDTERLDKLATRLAEVAQNNETFTVSHQEAGGKIGLKQLAGVKDTTDMSTMENFASYIGISTVDADATAKNTEQAVADAKAEAGKLQEKADALKAAAEKMVDGDDLTLQIGDTAETFNQLKVSVKDCHCAAMGIGDISVEDQKSASEAMAKIKDAINYVSDVRGGLGALQNRLEHTINNLSVQTENITAAESRIRDVDMAQEMMAYTKNNILVQASQAMLAQANQIPQGVLQLLQ